jgi:hypothetical protein
VLSASLKEMSGLKDVSGLFDRRVWLGSVLPAFGFAAITAAAGTGLASAKFGPLKVTEFWDHLGSGGQALLLGAAGVGTVFAALILESLHTSIIRFWEGYPAEGWLGWVLLLPTRPFFWAGRKLAECAWARRQAEGDELGKQVPALQKYEKAVDGELDQEPTYDPAAVLGKSAIQKADEIRAFVGKIRKRWWWYWWWYGWEKLEETMNEAREHRKEALARLHPTTPDGELKKQNVELAGVVQQLRDRVRRHVAELEGRQADLYAVKYRYNPPRGEPFLPTRFGRALRAAEAYPRERYGADAVLVWPRLAPLLPKEFTEGFSSAETAVTVTTTLATLLLVVGVPLAAAATAVVVTSDAPEPRPLWFGWQLVGAAWAVVLGLAWLCYQAAVGAAAEYGDQIRTAFDLYRRKVLEQMGYRLPPDAEAEKITWQVLTDWLLLGEGGSEPVQVWVPVPLAAVAKGATLVVVQMEEKEFPAAELPAGTVTDARRVVGKVMEKALAAEEPIPAAALTKGDREVALSIPGPQFAALGLSPGDVVDVTAVPPFVAGAAAVKSVAGLVVLRVGKPSGDAPGVAVVAAPSTSLPDLAEITAGDRGFLVARQV